MHGEPILENLAHPARGLAEPQRRNPGGAVERPDEVGEIAESDVIGDIGDRAVIVGQEARRMTQPRAHQILVRVTPSTLENSRRKWNGLISA